MVNYQASLQLSRKHSLYCVLSKALASQRAEPAATVPVWTRKQQCCPPPSGTADCPKGGQHSEIYLNCFIAVVFFISEIVLFNILNKILRNKW